MTTTKVQLDTELQDMIASTANIKADSDKRLRIFNRVFDRLQSYCNWMFTVRQKTFDYITDLDEYNIENYIGISDYKDIYSINGIPVTDPRWLKDTLNNVGHFDRDGNNYLKLNLSEGKSRQVDVLDSLTADGTWAVIGDTVGLVVDSEEYKVGQGSLKFNADVDASVSNYIGVKNTTFSLKDLSDYEDRGYFPLWVFLPSVTAFISVQLLWGSTETTAIWSKTETTPINKSSFEIGWNRVMFKWADATKTGSPDSSQTAYIEIRLNYEAGFVDTSNFRVNDLRLDEKVETSLEYFSTFMAKTTAGVWQRQFTTGTDLMLANDDLKPFILEWAFYELQRFTRKLDKTEISETKENVRELKEEAKRKYGFSFNRGSKRIIIKR